MERRHDEATLRTGRIIVGAMAMGLLAFAGIVVFLRPPGTLSGDKAELWRLIMAGFTAANAMAAILVGKLFVTRARARKPIVEADRRELRSDFLTLTILRGALVEGTGFFACSAYMVGSTIEAIFVAFACVAVLLLLVFPTEERFRTFEERVRRPE